MPTQLFALIPPEVSNLLLVLFLSFLIGLEREEQRQREGRRGFGGVRTFPLIGLLGYVVALISGDQVLPLVIGLAVVGAFLLLSYWHKLMQGSMGITTEVTALVVYFVGALIHKGHLWFACALVVTSLLLLELKEALEGLAERVEPAEIAAFTKFLLLTAVILPLVPNRPFGPFQINPFKTWLVVVAVSGLSYGSYVILKTVKGRGGIFATAILGGLYSSTVTTVVLARQAAQGESARAYSGAILAASGMMYLRALGLVWLFNRDLSHVLAAPLLILAFASVLGGWIWHRLPDSDAQAPTSAQVTRNPLELRTAFIFAILFMAMLVVTRLAVMHLGRGGVYLLGTIMGVADVDPYIMGMTNAASSSLSGPTPLGVAAAGILVATSANNLSKGVYAVFIARNRTGRLALGLLAGLAALGLAFLLLV